MNASVGKNALNMLDVISDMFMLCCTVQTLDEVCCIHPASVLLSPNSTIQEVGSLAEIIIVILMAEWKCEHKSSSVFHTHTRRRFNAFH